MDNTKHYLTISRLVVLTWQKLIHFRRTISIQICCGCGIIMWFTIW